MTDQTVFCIVSLVQVLLVSLVLPRLIVKRMEQVFRKYPPATYPKLYPGPSGHYETKRHRYRIANLVILVIGLGLVGVLLTVPRSGEWDATVALLYFLVQMSPFLFLDLASRRELAWMRETDGRSTRRAGLRPRRLFDFVSPALVGLAAAVYVLFVVFVLFIRQFEFPWFGGYWNIVGVTVVNLGSAAMIVRFIHGKRLDPHQSSSDRLRRIEAGVRLLVFMSIAITLFITLHVSLAALELRPLQPIAQSLYFQLLALISFQGYRVDIANFEVYRKDSVAT